MNAVATSHMLAVYQIICFNYRVNVIAGSSNNK